jgi:methylphosphotriester-DNA--protein-cysteine methyltransferase
LTPSILAIMPSITFPPIINVGLKKATCFSIIDQPFWAYLSRLFLQEMGKTFTDYLVDFRLKKGEELLKDTDMTVTAISLEIGYNDPHYFSYVYKKDRGYTPRDYRMKQRTIDE